MAHAGETGLNSQTVSVSIRSPFHMVNKMRYKPGMRACLSVLLATFSLAAFDKPDTNAVTAPRPIFKPEPKYSDEAREAKIEGAVLARVYIDAEGVVTQVEIVRPLGWGLDLAAMEALAQWRFEPAARAGQPVGTWANVKMNFRLL